MKTIATNLVVLLALAVFSSPAYAWEEKWGTSPMTDLSWYTLVKKGTPLPAEAPNNPPVLAISCLDHKNVVALYSPWEVRPSVGEKDSQRIRIRYDHNSPEEPLWRVDDDRHTLIAPDPMVQAELLRQSRRVRVELTTVYDGIRVVDFEVEGFDTSRGNLSGVCEWPYMSLEVVDVVAKKTVQTCSIPSPSFSDRLQTVLDALPRELLLNIEATVGEGGRLLDPKAVGPAEATTGLMVAELSRTVGRGRCLDRSPGELVRLQFLFKSDP